MTGSEDPETVAVVQLSPRNLASARMRSTTFPMDFSSMEMLSASW